ncbi:hypothetical protein WMY93_016966 [Mugilogobius chulae]|uniref:Uncharacterized protein n=1 Tax=Mugilogobius chulae TaxID=88201 RepID=A0AAW0NTB6_9GOBI
MDHEVHRQYCPCEHWDQHEGICTVSEEEPNDCLCQLLFTGISFSTSMGVGGGAEGSPGSTDSLLCVFKSLSIRVPAPLQSVYHLKRTTQSTALLKGRPKTKALSCALHLNGTPSVAADPVDHRRGSAAFTRDCTDTTLAA